MTTTINTLNNAGLTPLDMLDHSSGDSISLTIKHILTKEGAQRSANIVRTHLPASSSTQVNIHHMTMSQNIVSAQQDHVLSPQNDPQQPQTLPTQTSPRNSQSSQTRRNRWDKFENFCTTYLINQGNWIDKKTKEQFMVAATVIATMTFQSVISPPGGVWQEDTKHGNHACTTYDFCEAGTAVVGYVWSPDFMKFIFFNSASFFASLCVVLVLISGFPLGNKVIMRILAVLMIIAVTFMLLTYMWALGLVSPNHVYYRIRKLAYVMVGTWSFLLLVIGLIQITRVVFWIRSKRGFSTNASLSQNSPGGIANGCVQ
jgi:hypothetical protein